MANIKINSIGFGYNKNIKLSESLITAGTVMIVAGLAIIKTKSQWWCKKKKKTLDYICELYEAQNK